MRQRKMNMGVRQGEAADRFGDVGHLGLSRPHKLMSHGSVEKHLADIHGGTVRTAQGAEGLGAAANNLQFRSYLTVGRSASQHQSTHLGDRRQSLASKPQCLDLEQIVGVSDLASSVARHG